MTESELKQRLQEIDDRLQEIYSMLWTGHVPAHEGLLDLADESETLEDEKRRIRGYLKAYE